ncbi:hypothetical protein [Paraclostridium tenue]|uniref:Tyr recombinase domain-containing protein n=1 Tax=Paraclostridium tenue TaxID=1737 RepID=A0ABN1M1H1_9FIRM
MDIKVFLSLSCKMAVHLYRLIKENPMTYIKLPKANKIEDFNRILQRFPLGHKLHIQLQIAFHTGLRASEVWV